MLDNISLMYVSCYTYNSLWEPFLKLRTKYIGDNEIKMFLCTDLMNDLIINGNNLNILNYNIKSNFTLNGNFYDRYLYYLNNIDTEYILYFYDDMFFTQKIDLTKIDEILNIMKTYNNIKMVKLSLASFPTSGNKIILNDIKFIQANNDLDNYIFNIQPILIRKDFFIDLVNYCKINNTLTHQNGGLEIYGTEYFRKNKNFICLRVIEDIIKIPFGDHGIVISGIIKEEVRNFLKITENIDIKVYENNLIFELTIDEYNIVGERLKEHYKNMNWKHLKL